MFAHKIRIAPLHSSFRNPIRNSQSVGPLPHSLFIPLLRAMSALHHTSMASRSRCAELMR